MLADANWTYLILIRWTHLVCAGLLLGGTFFIAFIMPDAARDGESATAVAPPWRRRFKMLVHTAILLLLASGIYNSILYWPAYHKGIPLTHALYGPHLLFALIVFVILLVMLSRKKASPSERKWLRIAAICIFLAVLMASALKYAREHAGVQHTTVQHTTSYSIG